MDENGALREQIRQMAVEVQSLRETRAEHRQLLTKLESVIDEIQDREDRQQEIIERQQMAIDEGARADLVRATKWSLTQSLGLLGGSCAIMVMAAIATRAI